MEKLAWLHLRLAAVTPWKNNYNQQSAHIIYAVRSITRSVALSPIRRRSPVQVSLQSALVHGCAASFAKVSSAAILIVLVSCIFEHQCWCLLNGFFFSTHGTASPWTSRVQDLPMAYAVLLSQSGDFLPVHFVSSYRSCTCALF